MTFYTCTPDADPSLAGCPATLSQTADGRHILYFNEGSALEVQPHQIVEIKEENR